MSKPDDAVDKAYEALNDALFAWAQARTSGDMARSQTSDALEEAFWKWDKAIEEWGEDYDVVAAFDDYSVPSASWILRFLRWLFEGSD
jgi:hypothetical protein